MTVSCLDIQSKLVRHKKSTSLWRSKDDALLFYKWSGKWCIDVNQDLPDSQKNLKLIEAASKVNLEILEFQTFQESKLFAKSLFSEMCDLSKFRRSPTIFDISGTGGRFSINKTSTGWQITKRLHTTVCTQVAFCKTLSQATEKAAQIINKESSC